MVTRNSGTAMLTSTDGFSVGTTNDTDGRSGPRSPTPRAAMPTTAASRAPGTAHCRRYRRSTAHVRITGPASMGRSTTARTGAVQRLRMTPASIAPAIGRGMAAIARDSHGDRPARTIRAAHTANAPTAAGKPPGTGPVAASRAAPGVDHAMLIGMRYRSPSPIATTPIPTQSASSPDAAWAGVAPTARRPASTTVNELAYPTTALTSPDTIAWVRMPSPWKPFRKRNGP
ncbi:hypothetical protein GCM10007977_034220 [Dactylosporangium sucinum]|uniref:Uncharacterized protein n=1 Tax=Dactylosporangium sucinum TaxID=1424081 RepID=A0A917TP73_9ACTN|nr:hypothetical protein GCM10007977_034220 [Dactylosporangium sucinum]